MLTETPILYNAIRSSFESALKQAVEGDFVAKPKSLERYSKLRRQAVSDMRNANLKVKEKLQKTSDEIVSEYGISEMDALDITLTSWSIENSLRESGVMFGTEPFNFALEKPTLSKVERDQITSVSNSVMTSLQTLAKPEYKDRLPNVPMFPIEAKFENLALVPNAARIDFVLTNNGPLVIEVNSQWVDAINALSGFSKTYGDMQASKKVLDAFESAFKNRRSVALIDIAQVTGSRELGATKELEKLAEIMQKRNRIKRCEVINPQKTRLEYLKEFDAFYVNCDPKAFGYNVPDWMDLIIERVAKDPNSMFPKWRPLLDKKIILTLIRDTEKGIAPTFPIADYPIADDQTVLKGDGYSLNSVILGSDPRFSEFLNTAQGEPLSYVIQPFVEAKKFSSWVFDTSSKKIKYITDGYTKLNVWWINGQVVGMLMTVSASPLISDKGFNTVPIIK